MRHREEDIAAVARDLSPLGAALMRWSTAIAVGDDLAPTEEQATEIAEPLVRVAVRHLPILAEAGADTRDLAAAGGALVDYLHVVGPELMRRSRERRQERKVQRAPASAVVGRGVPVSVASGPAPAAPASTAVAASAAAGGQGYGPQSVSRGAVPVPNRDQGDTSNGRTELDTGRLIDSLVNFG